LFELSVQFETVISWLGTENTAAPNIDTGLETAMTRTARSFLTDQFFGTVCNLPTFFGFMGPLTLIGKILLNIQVDSVVFGSMPNTNRPEQLFSGILTVYFIN
jgi:hypothetical protein